jgi:NAD(P)-dependent dehydrogenase (short-subunit alcohol dehydrogenase family)
MEESTMRKANITPGTVLVTGANRGIGLEFARQYGDDGWRVLACCREPARAKELQEIVGAHEDRVVALALDVADAHSRSTLARKLGDEPIDLLIHNAGIYGPNGVRFGHGTDEQAWIEVFRVNTMAPLKLTELLVDNVAASKRRVIAAMSSGMGSIADNTSGSAYLYRSSKSALNAVARSLSIDLAAKKIKVVALCPGWVQTDMGGTKAPLPVARSVAGLRRVLDELKSADSGSFIRYNGERVPW